MPTRTAEFRVNERHLATIVCWLPFNISVVYFTSLVFFFIQWSCPGYYKTSILKNVHISRHFGNFICLHLFLYQSNKIRLTWNVAQEKKKNDALIQTSLTTRESEMVMSRAEMAIPPSPIRCKVLRPAFSTRKSWGGKIRRDRSTIQRTAREMDDKVVVRHSRKRRWTRCWPLRRRWWRRWVELHPPWQRCPSSSRRPKIKFDVSSRQQSDGHTERHRSSEGPCWDLRATARLAKEKRRCAKMNEMTAWHRVGMKKNAPMTISTGRGFILLPSNPKCISF